MSIFGDDIWYGLLDPNEKVVWQGRPSARLRLESRNLIETIAHLVLAVMGIVAMIGGAPNLENSWFIGLLLLIYSGVSLIYMDIWKAFVRSRTSLALTSKRALIVTNVFGSRKVTSYPITLSTPIYFTDAKRGSIFFASEETTLHWRKVKKQIGFEMIEDARSVYALFRKVQEAKP